MTADNKLYNELKPEVEKLVTPLFDTSEMFIRKRGAFLPHGAILNGHCEVEFVSFTPDDCESINTSAPEILSGLHQALRQAIKSSVGIASAVAEDVTITLDGQKSTKAIKVLFEHKAGLTVALYLPWKRKFWGGIEIGSPMTLSAAPEVCAWRN